MGRVARVAIGVVLLSAGFVLGLWGMFAIRYNGDRESGATYLSIG